jgi:bacterioferritin-associated ferredoxin
MIICICKNLSDTVLREFIRKGCSTLEELQFETGVCTQCETCLSTTENLIEETLNVNAHCCNRP